LPPQPIDELGYHAVENTYVVNGIDGNGAPGLPFYNPDKTPDKLFYNGRG